MHFPTRFLLVTLALLCGCDMAVEPSGARVLGILEWQNPPGRPDSVAVGATWRPATPVLVAPDTVELGVPFTATVTTVGPTVCWRPAGAAVELDPALATVTPYDFTPEDQDVRCGDAVVELPREVELRFTRRGEALVRVRGRRVVGGNPLGAEHPLVVEKRIRVR